MTQSLADRTSKVIQDLHPDGRDQGQRDLDAIWQSGADTYDKWLDLLQDQAADLATRLRLCWMLGRLGDEESLPALLTTLDDPEPQLRREAALALGTLADPRALSPLIGRLRNDPEVEVRAMAAHALDLLGDDGAAEPLLAVLQDRHEDAAVRGMAAESLAGLQIDGAVPALISALHDEAVEVRFWAAFALGELGSPAVIPHLAELAQRDQATLTGWWSVRKEALGAIEQIRSRP